MRRVAGYMFGHMSQQAPKGRQREGLTCTPPSAADLLRTVAETLAVDVVPATSGPAQHQAGLQQILHQSLPENSSWAQKFGLVKMTSCVRSAAKRSAMKTRSAVAAALGKDLPIAMKK